MVPFGVRRPGAFGTGFFNALLQTGEGGRKKGEIGGIICPQGPGRGMVRLFLR